MLLASMILAAAVGQACVEPPSRFGPPPCAAANVPGCLPGYRPQVDPWGRVTYVCDRAAYQAPPQQPAPSLGAPPDVAIPPPAPTYVPPPGPPPYSPARPYRRVQVGFVLMPGATTFDRGHTTDGTLALGLELRGPLGGAGIRFGYEYSNLVSVLDFAFKYDFIDGPVSPFLSLGIGGASIDAALAGAAPGLSRVWRWTGSISGGIDFALAPNMFATLELKQRVFARDGLDASDLHQTSFLVGVGVRM